MILVPRDYQEYAAQSVLDYFANGGTGNPLVAAPTGVGKSVMIARLSQMIYERFSYAKILVITDVKELIQQDHEKLLALWPAAPVGIYSAGLNRKDTKQGIIVGGIGSVAKCPLYFGKVDFVLIDEAHMISDKDSSMYRTFINDLKTVNPWMLCVGFTATKWRSGQGLLIEGDNRLFTDICCDMTTLEAFNWFLDQGYLCRLRPIRTETEYEAAGIRITAGEWNQGDLQKAADKADLTQKVVAEAIRIARMENRNCWLVFATGIQHTEHVTEELVRQGINATYVHSKMEEGERDERIAYHKEGRYEALVNMGTLTKGYDNPLIDYIVMTRKTRSASLWVQMLGRGTRPYYADGFDLTTKQGRLDAISNSIKKYCLVADFAANCRELGPINDPVLPKSKKKKEPGDAPIRICPKCGTYNHAAASCCDHCGHEFPKTIQIEAKAAKDELIREDKSKEPKPIEVKIEPVERVEYHPHFPRNDPNKKSNRPPSIRVTYWTGRIKRRMEWICLEHGGGITARSQRWWRDRCPDIPPPDNTMEAMHFVDRLKVPKAIHVRLDTEHPEIINYDF